jgi:hypothetical protein
MFRSEIFGAFGGIKEKFAFVYFSFHKGVIISGERGILYIVLNRSRGIALFVIK